MKPVQPGQAVLLVGGAPQLGSWDPAGGLALSWAEGHAWSGVLQLPAGQAMEGVSAKLAVGTPGGAAAAWEDGPNRLIQVWGGRALGFRTFRDWPNHLIAAGGFRV